MRHEHISLSGKYLAPGTRARHQSAPLYRSRWTGMTRQHNPDRTPAHRFGNSSPPARLPNRRTCQSGGSGGGGPWACRGAGPL